MSKSNFVQRLNRKGPELSRRCLLQFALLCAAMKIRPLNERALAKEKIAPHPRVANLRAGDLLWTSIPDAYIPYSSGQLVSEEAERAEWEQGRAEAIVSALRTATDHGQRLAMALKELDHASFRQAYVEGRRTGPVQLYAGGTVGVGHVAIVGLRGSDLSIIEARPAIGSGWRVAADRFRNGVIETPYDAWIAEHRQHLVWHGRIRDASEAERARIADAARRYVGRDYWFWNLNLADASAFYCSKLVWLSVRDALGLPIDSDPDPLRYFWLSPKQVMNLSPTVEMLHVPAPYGI